MNRKRMEEEEVFRGECMTRTASYHAVQDCNVNMQLGGATSRDLAPGCLWLYCIKVLD